MKFFICIKVVGLNKQSENNCIPQYNFFNFYFEFLIDIIDN